MDNRATNISARDAEWADGEGDRVICVVARDVFSLENRDLGLTSVTKTFWRERWLILGCVVLFTVLAAAYAFLATTWYLAETVLTPVAPQEMSRLSGQLGGIGMLAGLAGLSLDKTDTSEPIGVLKSREFARQFIEDNGLLHVLLADKWDAHKGRWRELNPKRQPDIRDAVRYFDQRVLSVDEDKRTGLFSVGVRWKDPAVAANWANMLVERVNQQMRARALTQAQGNIDYLQKELALTPQVAMQEAAATLLESELQKAMLARGNKEFVFRVVDVATIPKIPAWPKPLIIVALGVLAGGCIGLIAAMMRQSFRSRPASAPPRAQE